MKKTVLSLLVINNHYFKKLPDRSEEKNKPSHPIHLEKMSTGSLGAALAGGLCIEVFIVENTKTNPLKIKKV